MHREYRPADLNILRDRAFGAAGGHGHHDHGHAHGDDEDHHHHDDRALYALTGLMAILIGGELLFNALGWERWRAPGGVSLALIAAVIGGARIVYGAIEALLRRSIGADVALAQACIAALMIGQPFVAAEVVFIALVGEVLEALTFERAQRSIHKLLDQAPRTARVKRDGELVEVPAADVRIADVVVVRPGERLPVDGTVLVGRSSVDQSALTGESIPVDVGPGEPVYSGTINQFGVIEVEAVKVGHETTLGQVLRLVIDARKRKSPIERTADRLARYFLPVVETVAGLTLAFGLWLGWPDVWLRTVAVLVVACPCALILATPAAVLASMAWLARHGVLIKGGAALERLAGCDTFAFDKTGTLTVGKPGVASVIAFEGWSEDELLRLAATAESANPHPLAKALVAEAGRRGVSPGPVLESVAMPGAGVSARFQGEQGGPERTILVGNARLFAEYGVALDDAANQALALLDDRGETASVVAVDGRAVGVFGLRDAVRPEAHDVIHDLKHLKITEIAILTGDRPSAAKAVGKKTHVKTVEAGLSPADKARWVEAARARGRTVAMVGDGINDAPALASAHVGIALGGIGADLAAEAGDLIILGEPLRVLPDLVRLSRATVRVIRQNILIFAFGLNAVAMGSAALGWLGPVPAALLHQAGSLLVLLNAMRLLAFGDWHAMPPFRQLAALGPAVRRLDDRFDPGHALAHLAAHWRAVLRVSAALGLLVYLTWGWSAIGPGEVGLVTRFGRFTRVLGPGLHAGWPPPIERVIRVEPRKTRSLDVGFRAADVSGADPVGWGASHARTSRSNDEDEALILTGDGQLVELSVSVQYQTDDRDPRALWRYAFGVADAGQALKGPAEAAVRAAVSRRSLETLVSTGRREAEQDALATLQSAADRYGLGVRVTDLAFQDVHPPIPVVDAYRDVSRAESDRQRRRNEARSYRAQTEADAKGRAALTVNRAAGLAAGRTRGAEAAADVFNLLADARSTGPALTDQRLYWTGLSRMLGGRNKLILDDPAGKARHLFVPTAPGAVSPAPAFVGPPAPRESEPR